MSELLPRSAWGARAPRPGPGRLDPGPVVGVAFHWPGVSSSRPFSKRAVPRALRSWQNLHMDTNGWSDIAYQVAVDNYGRRWELRGLETQSGANGNSYLNARYCAVLLVLAQGEEPSPAMLEAARETVREARELYPNARRLTGHGRLKATSCPGPAVLHALDAGRLEPDNYPEEVLDVTPAQFWRHRIPVAPGKRRPAQLVLRWAWMNARRARRQAGRAVRETRELAQELEELRAELAALREE